MGDRPQIAVFGCGALGGYVGGYLTRDGHDVALIDPWPEHVVRMKDPGLRLQGLTEPENFVVKANAVLADDLPPPDTMPPFDIIFVSVKSFDTRATAERLAPYLTDDGVIVSLQNGINEPAIASVVGEDRTIGVIASQISVALPGPGHVERKVKLGGAAHTVFRVGTLDGAVTPVVTAIAEMLSSIDSAVVTENLLGERWSKLVANCMRNPVAAVTGEGTNFNLRDDHIRRLTMRVATEAIEVAWADGVNLVNISGMAPDVWHAAGQGDVAAVATVEAKLFDEMERRDDSQRPSMAQDMQKGRKTEIDFINGHVVARAKARGIDVPVNAALVDLVKQVEGGARSPSVDILNDI